MNDVFLPGGPLDESRFSPTAWAMLRHACQAATETKWETLRSPHVFMGLMASPDETVKRWCEALETTPAKIHRQFVRLFTQPNDDSPPVRLHREFCSTNTIKLIRCAASQASELGLPLVRPLDLLGGLLTDDGCVAACFRESGYSASVLRVLARGTESGTAERNAT